ncbi:MAG: hypothetical protein Q7S22_03710 [Candidatus Micrarchaeota archaeon]|nr:hypothetical protein [Candidatus Micrarchaeota archaeon]
MVEQKLQKPRLIIVLKTDEVSMCRARCFAANRVYQAFDVAGAAAIEEKRGQGTLCLSQHLDKLKAGIGPAYVTSPVEREKLYWKAPGCSERDVSVVGVRIDLPSGYEYVHPHTGKTRNQYYINLELPPTVPWKHYFYRETMNFRLPELQQVEVFVAEQEIRMIKLKLLEKRLSGATIEEDSYSVEVNANFLRSDYTLPPPLAPQAIENHVCAIIADGVVTFWHESEEHSSVLIVPAEHYIEIVKLVGQRLLEEPLAIMPLEMEERIVTVVIAVGNLLVNDKSFDYK